MWASLLILAGHRKTHHRPHQEHSMSHALTMTRSHESGIPTSTPVATALVSYQPEKTMIRLGLAVIALACCLIAVTGDARAQTEAPDTLAYCTRLYGLYWKHHANYFHHDGTWAQAELALSDCRHGKLEAGIDELEHILRNDLFVIPGDRSPTYQGFAKP
jgi:hypothetical protein